jgi:ribonuclease P/MRP protein subunit RPP40
MGQTQKIPEDHEKLQRAVDAVDCWAKKWGMEFNVGKCKVMHMGLHNNRHQYTMKGQILQATKVERDIGVEVADNLKPGAHCSKAARTAQTVLGQLSRAFHYRDRHVFIRLYKQYVRPHLETSSQAWSPWTEKDKETLERVQKRAVNMVSGLKSKDYAERLKELGLQTLEERRHQADMQMVYKIMHGKGGLKKETWFEMAEARGHGTRSGADPLNIRVGRGRLEIRRNFFSNRVIEYWNSIPSEIKNARNVEMFKKMYRKLRGDCWASPEGDEWTYQWGREDNRIPDASTIILPGLKEAKSQVKTSK